MLETPPVALFLALPKINTPPQSPRFLCPLALDEVKTIGLLAVPTALIFPPLETTKHEFETFALPLIQHPGWIVSVTPFLT
jgi:hypothetical protein